MPRYLTTSPCYIGGQYTAADPRNPAEVVLPEGVQPSRQFVPLDEPARRALEKLGVKRAIPEQAHAAPEKKAAPKQSTIGEL